MKKKIDEITSYPTSTSTSTSTTTSSQSGKKKNVVNIKKKDLNDPNVTNSLTKMKDVEVNILDEEVSVDSVIEPQDQATIKYLSNVKDAKTGNVSKPFVISNKKYQMVRGITPEKEIVLGVFCHDDLDANGENIIHSIEDFEANIVNPVMEEEKKMQEEALKEEEKLAKDKAKEEEKLAKDKIKQAEQQTKKAEKAKEMFNDENDSLNLAQCKHYLVNQKTGKFRKFKSIHEVAEAVMGEGEKYMNLKEFKKFFETKIFGATKHNTDVLTEVTPTGEENDEEMNAKAKKLMDMIGKRIPTNIISTIKTPVAKREVIAAFAEMIGVPRQNLAQLISGLKDMATSTNQNPTAQTNQNPTAQAEQPIVERKVLTKQALIEEMTQPKVIKTLKIKDIQ